VLLLSISLKIGSKKLDRRANELQVENTRTANQIELFGFDQSKTRANQRQEKSAGACEGSGQEIVSHKSSYVFWSGLIFLFFYITS
jgi:hypothetical protein